MRILGDKNGLRQWDPAQQRPARALSASHRDLSKALIY
jgi:hypothetical protein